MKKLFIFLDLLQTLTLKANTFGCCTNDNIQQPHHINTNTNMVNRQINKMKETNRKQKKKKNRKTLNTNLKRKMKHKITTKKKKKKKVQVLDQCVDFLCGHALKP